MAGRDYLLDISRLIWRRWSGRLPTGIDRVCLEYARHFGSRAGAVVQYRDKVFVLTSRDSDRLVGFLLESGSEAARGKLIALTLLALARSSRSPPRPGMIYLNVGHTGLDRPGLLRWMAESAVRAVHLIHDLIPISHPQFCRPGEAERHRARMINALVSATGLICNSEVTRHAMEDFSRHVGLPMPRAIVAWISGSPVPTEPTPKVLTKPFFVTLGTIEGRKNHVLLLNVWNSLVSRLGDRAPMLIIVGQRGWEADAAFAILDSGGKLDGYVVELPRCDDEELAGWLVGARSLLMPSFAEGFGLPIIEALQQGVPVIANNLPVYREVAGDIPTYLNPSDAHAWEQRIEDFMADDRERARQLAAIREYRAPDWASHFGAVEEWLDTLQPVLQP